MPGAALNAQQQIMLAPIQQQQQQLYQQQVLSQQPGLLAAGGQPGVLPGGGAVLPGVSQGQVSAYQCMCMYSVHVYVLCGGSSAWALIV